MRFRFLTILAAISVTPAFAAHLTPSQALSLARGEMSTSNVARVKASDMTLVYQVQGQESPNIYVFTPTNAENKGFMIVSADDIARPLLGYSDEDTFDAANIPPALSWWMTLYSDAIDNLRNNPEKSLSLTIANPVAMKSTLRKAKHASVSPLCSTTWNQGDPYNRQCPIVGGARSVTGCVATAMAQVMKVHKWPTTGTGSHSYQFQNDYGIFSDSFNFGSTTFSWANMRDSYASSFTTAQANAVASLMHACGVACEMSYAPDASGSNEVLAAYGMLNFLNYDNGIYVAERDWYTTSEWDTLVYGEIAAGRPVLYCGNDGTSGHAFVCDGYNSSDYYHINWGWGGAADGYFLLADLNPYTQGIGGGSGYDGFNYGQSALIGVRHPVSGSQKVYTMAFTDLSTGSTSYSRYSSTSVDFKSSGYFVNYSASDMNNFYLGVVLESTTGSTISYVGEDGRYSESVLHSAYGYPTISFRATDFPVGTWKAYPAFSFDRSNWTKMRSDLSQSPGYLILNVTSSSITVSDPGTDNPEDPASVTVELKSTDAESTVYTGDTYNFTYTFTSTAAFSNTYYLILANMTDMRVADQGTSRVVSASRAGTITADFSIEIPDDYDAGKSYAICLCHLDENVFMIDTRYDITISADKPQAEVTIGLHTFSPDYGDGLVMGNVYEIDLSFTATGPISESYYAVLINYGTYDIISESEEMRVTLRSAGTAHANCTLEIPSRLDLSAKYALFICTLEDYTYNPIKGWYVDIVDDNSGVATITPDGEITQELYDMAGRKVTNPRRGSIYILKTPQGGRKIRF